MGKPADNTHIDFFQGFSQFHEHGIPRRLPIEEEQKIDANPCLIAKAMEIQNAESDIDTKRLKREYGIRKNTESEREKSIQGCFNSSKVTGSGTSVIGKY